MNLVNTIIFIALPLGLLIGIEKALFQNYRKAAAENPEHIRKLALAWAFKSLLGLLPSFLFVVIFAWPEKIGIEIFDSLAFGWIGVLWENGSALFQHWEALSRAVAVVILLLIGFHWNMEWRYQKSLSRMVQGKRYWPARWTAGLAALVLLFFIDGYAFLGAARQTVGIIQEPIVIYKPSRTYDFDTKSNLRNVFLACKAYWADHGGEHPCTREVFHRTEYGYIQSPDVRIDATGGEKNFRAAAVNINSHRWYWLNETGYIQPLPESIKIS